VPGRGEAPRPGPAARAVDALAREARVAGSPAHPGIRRLLSSRLDQPLPHLVFEYVEGPTLDDALADQGPLHPIDVLLVGMQLAAALGHLHGRGLAHLDVKPGNVVLRDGRPVLIDLGLARPVGEAPAGRHRRGSPPWMAPEQVRRQPASPGMDLFALGAVLFELATGTQTFDPADDGPSERRWPQLAGPPPPARCWPCWPKPCRPTPPRRTGCGLPGLPGLAGWQASAMERPPAGFHDLRRHCRWHTGRMPLVRMVATGKTSGRPGTGPGSRPSWGPGGAAGGCASSPGAGLPRGR
jgi:serine/threonine protein kinase